MMECMVCWFHSIYKRWHFALKPASRRDRLFSVVLYRLLSIEKNADVHFPAFIFSVGLPETGAEGFDSDTGYLFCMGSRADQARSRTSAVDGQIGQSLRPPVSGCMRCGLFRVHSGQYPMPVLIPISRFPVSR